jgi:hypothetical protein
MLLCCSVVPPSLKGKDIIFFALMPSAFVEPMRRGVFLNAKQPPRYILVVQGGAECER